MKYYKNYIIVEKIDVEAFERRMNQLSKEGYVIEGNMCVTNDPESDQLVYSVIMSKVGEE